ncbi:MAG: hypothetical protein KGI60_02175 [Patescibacteria group bacterium]|nr:hypothetical protein [Patescibacteria group bacterium]
MSSIFKAYDVRGVYPEELNEAIAEKVAAAMARHFGRGAKLIIGRDARLSSPSLYKAVRKGLQVKGEGLKIIDAGLMTTPTLYFLVNTLKAAGGIMVTASHNPKQYNGLKVVRKQARSVSGVEVEKIMTNS